MENWDVAKPVGVCSVTGRKLEEGEEFFAVLFEDGDSLRRMDYSLAAWSGPPEGCFCHFRTRMPVKVKKKAVWVDNDMLVAFFQRLADASETSRLSFRFVLALMLMRKRILKYEDSFRDGEGREYWQMRLAKEQTVHRVFNPQLGEEQIREVSQQLSAILAGHHDTQGLTLDDSPISAEA